MTFSAVNVFSSSPKSARRAAATERFPDLWPFRLESDRIGGLEVGRLEPDVVQVGEDQARLQHTVTGETEPVLVHLLDTRLELRLSVVLLPADRRCAEEKIRVGEGGPTSVEPNKDVQYLAKIVPLLKIEVDDLGVVN